MRIPLRTILLTSWLIAGCAEPEAEATPAVADPEIEGAWRPVEITTTGPTGATNPNPQPGLMLFVDGHYVHMQVNGSVARPIPPQGTPTAAQEVARLQPITAQSGTYEVAAGFLVTRPIVAKNPSVMAPGSFSRLSLNVAGDTMTLVQAEGPNGPVVNPTTTRYVRARGAPTSAPLDGAWRVVELTTTGPDGAVNSAPEPGLRLYVDGHYSLLQLQRTRGPQPDSTAGDEAFAEVWTALTANAGTAAVEGQTVKSKAFVAMSPAVMEPARGPAVRSYRIVADTLWLTQISDFAGLITNPLTEELVRVP